MVLHAAIWRGVRGSKGRLELWTQRISGQLSQLLLRWGRNTRNVHLLRGLPSRLVQEVAGLHD